MIADIIFLVIFGMPDWVFYLLLCIIPFLLGWWFGTTFTVISETKLAARVAEHPDYRALQDRLNTYEKEHAELKYKLERMEEELNACRKKNQSSDMERLMYKARLQELGELENMDTSAQQKMAVAAPPMDDSPDDPMGYSNLFAPDNLQIIEGIGPKVESILKENAISSWKTLSTQSQDHLNSLLKDNKLTMMKPDTWPQQAELAAKGKWTELVDFQKYLDGGKEESQSSETPAKIEKMALKMLGFSQNPEDLKIIEGIGPKIEGLLKAEGIKNWSDLAQAPLDKLEEILKAAGPRYKLASPDTWPQQAELAAGGRWKALKDLQDRLDGGRT